MSARGESKAQSFGPGASRAVHNIGHIQFRTTIHSTYGVTFALRTAEGPDARPDLFSGHVDPEMPRQLMRLAEYLDGIMRGRDK